MYLMRLYVFCEYESGFKRINDSDHTRNIKTHKSLVFKYSWNRLDNSCCIEIKYRLRFIYLQYLFVGFKLLFMTLFKIVTSSDGGTWYLLTTWLTISTILDTKFLLQARRLSSIEIRLVLTQKKIIILHRTIHIRYEMFLLNGGIFLKDGHII